MNNFQILLNFMGEHPFLAFMMICATYYTITCPIRYIIRHLNIRKAGWPPAHLDIDGDYHSVRDALKDMME